MADSEDQAPHYTVSRIEKGSAYDPRMAGLTIPPARQAAAPDSGRSAYDPSMIVDTIPPARVTPPATITDSSTAADE